MRARLASFSSLSRLPHVVLDVATPAMAALVWIGRLPPAVTVVVGLLTAFSGYTAVYALNDLVDLRVNRASLEGGDPRRTRSRDSAAGRHPVATGRMSARAGWLWAASWGLAALAGAWFLNPVCALLFLGGCLLEALYCSLYRVTLFRFLVSGVVKSVGAASAVLAVDPRPSLPRLLLLLALVFLWELGGQNIPSDWSDIDEDLRMRGHSIPLRVGAAWSTTIMVGCLAAATALSVEVARVFPVSHRALALAAFLVAGAGLLIYPSIRLCLRRGSAAAARVFHSASFYPLALLAVVAAAVLTGRSA